MSEINEIDKLVLVDVPKVIENEQIYVYIPIAVGDKPGLIAIPANSKDFEVVNGNLKLKWDIDEKLKNYVPRRSQPNIVYTTDSGGNDSAITFSSGALPGVIAKRTDNGDLIVLDAPVDEHGAVNKKYADRIFNDGGTIKKDLNVLGDLKVQGNLVYVTGTIEGIEKQFVELNTNKKLVIGQSGLLINKGITEAGDLGTYAIVYDAAKDAVVCGLGTTRVDKIDGKDVLVFKFNDGEGLPLTIRDESDKMTDGHLLQWDADSNKLTDTGKSINDLLVLNEPTGVQTEFVVINKDFDGNIKQMSLRGVFTPLTDYETFLPVLRGLQGQVKGQTAPEGYQTDLDLINRGELRNYEKTPHYVLIEKVITGYSLLNAAPSDFATNYTSYYKTNGKARNDIDFAYVALTERPTSFEQGKYYYKTTESAILDRHGESGKEPDGTPYAFKNMYLYFENLQTEWAAYTHIHFYNGNSPFPYHFYLSRNNPGKMSDVYANIYGNMMTALSTKLNSEMHANSDISIMRATIKDNMVLSGFSASKLPVDTTILIYGAK